LAENLIRVHGQELGHALALPVRNHLLRTIEAKGQRFLSTSDVQNLMRNTCLLVDDLILVFRGLRVPESELSECVPQTYANLITALESEGVQFPKLLKVLLCPICFHVFRDSNYTGEGVSRVPFYAWVVIDHLYAICLAGCKTHHEHSCDYAYGENKTAERALSINDPRSHICLVRKCLVLTSKPT
jgi:hypothetical protein